MNDIELREEINKRLTLNWLIQGAAQHAGMTAHHLVRDELGAIHPSLVLLYDQYALINLLQYWSFDAVMLFGWPPRFWKRAASNPRHPFFNHPVLSRHGGMLAADSRQRAIERAGDKDLTLKPILFVLQIASVVGALQTIEAGHHPALIDLAKQTTVMVWGIPTHRLDAILTTEVAFGNLSRPQTWRGRIWRKFAVGYGGVLRRGDTLDVVARGTNWYLLAKELVKGTAELICLHGMNQLSEESYRHVVHQADRLEYEPWMLQTGGELWRRLLTVLPEGSSPADMLMHLSRLPAPSLERLILAVIEQPEWARELLAGLGRGANA